MNVYKLQYKNKETAIADLIAKGVYIETEEGLSYGQGIQAIVEIGLIVLENGTYSEDGTEITPPIFADGYHYDIMCEQEIDFGVADVTDKIKNPKHSFAGYHKEEIILKDE
jgi:hypothetical protein